MRSCLRSVVFFIIFITCITGYVLSFEAGGNVFKTVFGCSFWLKKRDEWGPFLKGAHLQFYLS